MQLRFLKVKTLLNSAFKGLLVSALLKQFFGPVTVQETPRQKKCPDSNQALQITSCFSADDLFLRRLNQDKQCLHVEPVDTQFITRKQISSDNVLLYLDIVLFRHLDLLWSCKICLDDCQ